MVQQNYSSVKSILNSGKINSLKGIGTNGLNKCPTVEYEKCEFIKCIAYIISYYLLLKDSPNNPDKKTYQKQINEHYKKLSPEYKKYIQDKVALLFNGNFLNNSFRFYPNYKNNITIIKSNESNIVKLFQDYEDRFFKNRECIDKIKLTSYVKKNNNKNKNICLGRKLGSGSFAAVYEYDKDKVLRLADLTSLTEDFEVNLEKDGNINQYKLTQLCPDSVCKLYDYGNYKDNENQIYGIMEKGLFEFQLLVNKSIEDNNKEIFLLCLKIIIDCITKIQIIHKNGYYHLDIKPENIMIFEGNEKDIHISDELKSMLKINTNYLKPKYIDFGFSKKISEISNLNRRILGTPEYIYKNSVGRMDENSDLYPLLRIFQSLVIYKKFPKNNMNHYNSVNLSNLYNKLKINNNTKQKSIKNLLQPIMTNGKRLKESKFFAGPQIFYMTVQNKYDYLRKILNELYEKLEKKN